MSASIATEAAVDAAMAGASDIALSAYVLRRGCAVENGLERAGDRGARVSVTLDGHPYAGSREPDGAARANRRTAEALRRHGVTVHLTSAAEVPVHLKAAVVDGTAFLDDRNWAADGRDTIVATSDPGDVEAVRDALAGASAGTPDLALDKARALRLEAQAIYRAAGDRVDVESESFGYSPVYSALRYRAEHGAHVRLVVSAREFRGGGNGIERGALRRLRDAGVEIRVSAGNEKLCAAGDRGWVGSANASYAGAPMRDWGLQTRDPSLVGVAGSSLRGHVERLASGPLAG